MHQGIVELRSDHHLSGGVYKAVLEGPKAVLAGPSVDCD